MKRFIIERDIPAAGQKPLSEIRATAKVSNDVMAELAPKIQWDHSYVAGDKIYCVYLAEDASVIEEHSKRSGIPFTSITEVRRVIDPTAATAKSD